jgi:serine protease Do
MRGRFVPVLLGICLLPLSALADAGAEVFQSLKPAVFQIKTAISESAPKSSYGTGFVVRKEGLLLTNFHVVAESVLEPDRYRVFLAENGGNIPAEVLLVNPVNDLALLRVKKTFPVAVEIAPAMPAQGEPIYSIGMPEDLNMSIVTGTFNGVLREGPYAKIHMSSPINPGMSGGPTLDGKGRLVGVNVSKLLFSSNISFSVPKTFAQELLEIWERNPQSAGSPSSLDLEADIARQLKLAGDEVVKAVAGPGRRSFGAWKVPALPGEIRCWSTASPAAKERKFRVTSESCQLQNSAYLGQHAAAGEFSLELRECKGAGLNGMQFFTLVSDVLDRNSKSSYLHSLISREHLSEFTAPACTTKKIVNAAGVPLLTHACLREYVRYPEVYQMSLDLATLRRGSNNLVLTLGASGLSFAGVEAVTRHFVDGVKEEGQADVAH